MTNPTTASPVRSKETNEAIIALQVRSGSAHAAPANSSSITLGLEHIDALLDHIAQLEASQPTRSIEEYESAIALMQIEINELKEAIQPKPQSDEGLREAAKRAHADLVFHCTAYPGTESAVLRVARDDLKEALSQAPVPTTNGGETDE